MTTSSPSSSRRGARLTITLAGVAVAGALALVLSGCSGNSSTPSSGASNSSQGQGGSGTASGQGGSGTGRGGFSGFGGVSGVIAAVQGTTLQVQNAQAGTQTAVSYTAKTTIEKNATVTLAAVKVGECVVTSSFPAGGAGGTGTTTGAAGSGTSGSGTASSGAASASTAVTTVAISQPVNGSCTSGFGGAGRGFGAGGAGNGGTGNGTGRTFSPRPQASGRPSGGFAGRTLTLPTSGKVTAVSGSTITVDALDFQTQKTASKTVTVDSSTTYSETQKATASALTVNECVTARGTSDSSGGYAAAALTVSDPAADGSCSSGFGGGRGFGGGGFGGQGGTGAGSGTGSSTNGSGSND